MFGFSGFHARVEALGAATLPAQDYALGILWLEARAKDSAEPPDVRSDETRTEIETISPNVRIPSPRSDIRF